MKEICAPTSSQNREHVLESFGLVTGSIPYDIQAVDKARQHVEKEGGRELLVEACCTAGAFEAITKLVDGTGRQVLSERSSKAKFLVMKLFKNRHTVVGIVAATVAAALATILAMER